MAFMQLIKNQRNNYLQNYIIYCVYLKKENIADYKNINKK